jgi:transcriptional regulator with XRE-family HTH domain
VEKSRTAAPSGFGELLRRWRERRRLSQLDLATDAEISTRHLSFIETGRAQPSREMVLLLARALDMPLRDRNDLLVAAGFAAIYRESGLNAPVVAQARRTPCGSCSTRTRCGRTS